MPGLTPAVMLLCLVAAEPGGDGAAPPATQPAGPVRLFILSGQSNMVRVDPAAFAAVVREAFPADRVVVVHRAKSGQLIRRWDKGWEVAEGEQLSRRGGQGAIYDELMADVEAAMEGLPEPASVTFVWMQGEADARSAAFGEAYAAALGRLIGQFEQDLGREELHVVIGRISDFGLDPARATERGGWQTVRAAQVAFAEADPRTRAWVDTDDLNGGHDGLHYTKEGYATLTRRFAEAAVELLGSKAPAATRPATQPGPRAVTK